MPPAPQTSKADIRVGFLAYGIEGEPRDPAYVGYYHRVDRLRAEAESRGYDVEFSYTHRGRSDRSAIKRIFTSGWVREKFRDAKCLYCASATTAAIGVWAMRKTAVPVLYDIHTPPVGEKWLNFKFRKSLRNFLVYLETCFSEALAIKYSDYILWSSLIQRDYYSRRGFPKDRLREIRHGVDVDQFDSGPVPAERPPLLAYAGTMVRYQGAEKLIEAFSRMPKGSIRLRMIGFTDRESEMRRFADESGIETMPQIPQAQVANRMRDAHCTTIVAHPLNKKYKNGAAPTKWPECLALGRPILSMDVYDTAQMIPELRVGWVVENSVDGLVAGMNELCATPYEDLSAMGSRAREEAIKNYAWPVIGEKFANVIEEAVRR